MKKFLQLTTSNQPFRPTSTSAVNPLTVAVTAAACALLLLALSAFFYCLCRRKTFSGDPTVNLFNCKSASAACQKARNTMGSPELQPLLAGKPLKATVDDEEQQLCSSRGKITESEVACEPEESNSEDVDAGVSENEAETEILLHFLISLREEKKKQVAKLEEVLNFLNEDIKQVERSYSLGTYSVFPDSDISRMIRKPFVDEERLMRNINQLESSYIAARSRVLLKEASSVSSNDKNVMESEWRHVENVDKEPRRIQSSVSCLESFCEGLCKFARYSKFEECGRLGNSDELSSGKVMCGLSFDRDEDYIAAGGISRKIKIFELSSAISSDSDEIQYPVVQMSNESKISSVCWNTCLQNHLASSDYDGEIKMWDAGTGQLLYQYTEHEKRAWSVHISLSDPKMFASGSDDCSVKVWNINEKNSVETISMNANICCVQFSPSTNLLLFGSSDHKVYGYDLRHTRIPWCSLTGHGKSVSYVKFIDAEAVVTASTDNSLKLWDLKKTSSSALSSDASVLTFKGHRNKKNFVGLSVLDGYIACGSESNEVYCYHKSLPVPIATHEFEPIDPISDHQDNGDFVSSVCWRKKSDMLVAANSVGIVKLLQMV